MSKKGDETKKMILEAATELFGEKGFKDVSMSDICDRTSLSRGGLYRHYSSTTDIFKELISGDDSFDERIRNKESAVSILNSVLKNLEDEIRQSEKSLSLAIYEYASVGDNSKEFLEIEKKAKKRWKKLIRYGIETGEFNVVDEEAVAEMILYYYQGLRMWSRVVNMGRKPAKNFKDNILEILIGGN